jgi:hypothetical protein
LVDYISDNVLEESITLSNKLSVNSYVSYALTKQMINDISTMSMENAVNFCVNLNTISRSSDDFKERIKKFLDR